MTVLNYTYDGFDITYIVYAQNYSQHIPALLVKSQIETYTLNGQLFAF